MKILVVGPNNCKKNMFAKALSRKTGIKEIECDKILGIRGIDINTGKLIKDELVNAVMENIKFDKNIIISGYPRTINQNKYMLDNILKPDLVIVLNISEDEIVKRNIFRGMCPECRSAYRFYGIKTSRKESACSNFGTCILQKKNKQEQIIRAKYSEYIENIYPIINYYKYSPGNVVFWEFDDSDSYNKAVNSVADYINYTIG